MGRDLAHRILRYRQTWPYVSRLWCRGRVGRRLAEGLQGICGILTGHEQSRTELGYGGGGVFDVYCRWCNFRWQIPVAEHPSGQHLIALFHADPPGIP